jgi:uncharacterized protein (DUF4415 family)
LAKVDATTDEDIARQMVEDDTPELTDAEWEQGEVWEGNHYIGRVKDVRTGRGGRPKGSGTKEMVTLRIDRDILDRFRAGGPGWQTRLNDVLRVAVTRVGATASAKINAAVYVEAPSRPAAGTNARLIVEVLKEMPSGTARADDIRKALKSNKGVSLGFTSIRRALGQLADREEVTSPDKGETWCYVGG